tara:strand:- start:236 stop:355 length:120 start_codon:yes stop_codon:yes gene_type:complete
VTLVVLAAVVLLGLQDPTLEEQEILQSQVQYKVMQVDLV